MVRSLFVAAVLHMALFLALFMALPGASSFAATAQQKLATCKFGADDQKLQGNARKTFMAKCMSNKNDPRGTGAAGAVPPPPKN
jgi:hypothetical protein